MKQPPKYFFNDDGLRFSVQYLFRMKKEILSLSISEQSEFVDMVTYELTTLGKLVIPTQTLQRSDIVKANTTSVGNTAFVALFHPNEAQRELAKTILQRIKNLV